MPPKIRDLKKQLRKAGFTNLPDHDPLRSPADFLVRSHWSDEDDAWLAEAVGIPGTRTHADKEAEARAAARELATEWAEIQREAASMSLDTFARWMHLDERLVAALAAAAPDPTEHRSLTEWNRLLKTTATG